MTWRQVTRDTPCPACGHAGWCAWTPDGKVLRCMRQGETPDGMRHAKEDADGGVLFVFKRDNGPSVRKMKMTKSVARALDWVKMVERFAAAISDERRDALAADLGVRSDALQALGVGWATRADLGAMRAGGAGWSGAQYPNGAFTFPERSGDGRLVGVSLRDTNGRKGSPSGLVGGKRGLIVPATLGEQSDSVCMVEGPSDVAACLTLGIAAVGRPSNRAGANDLAKLLKGYSVLVVGERDTKPDGSWPGRDGAEAVAQRLATSWRCEVPWTLPPSNAKDLRAWLQARIAEGLDLSDVEACIAAGCELLAELKAAAMMAEPAKLSQSELLVRLALERYRIGRTDTDDPFAVEHDGPNVALMFRGSRDALRATLAREFRRCFGRTPNSSALSDAMTVLQGEALEANAEPVAIRVALYEGGLVIDLGDTEGQAVIVCAGRWELVERSPILFRRTALTAALPVPEPGGDLSQLRELLNVTDDSWPLVRAWLVAALLPEMPHPILMLGGIQGTGKSTAARMLIGLFDPSPAPLRSQPRDPEQWAMATAGSWGVAVDNVSGIPRWWSDALCKTVTGDGWVRRKLYTDSELAVLCYRRVVILTSIDAGALRGDLGDRSLLVDMEAIQDDSRRTEAELDDRYKKARPRLLAALLELVAAVLQRLPNVTLPTMPRMADFAHVLAALDAQDGDGKALDLYLAQRGRIAGDVIEGDVVASSILKLIEQKDEWSGTSGELLTRIGPDKPSKQWPANGQAMTGRLKRLIPALESAGVVVTIPKHRTNRGRIITINKTGDTSSRSSPSSPEAAQESSETMSGDDLAAPGEEDHHLDRHPETAPVDAGTGIGDESDNCDDLRPTLSVDISRAQVRTEAAQILRAARRNGTPATARTLRHVWQERLAICMVDGDMSIRDAEAVALDDLRSIVA